MRFRPPCGAVTTRKAPRRLRCLRAERSSPRQSLRRRRGSGSGNGNGSDSGSVGKPTAPLGVFNNLGQLRYVSREVAGSARDARRRLPLLWAAPHATSSSAISSSGSGSEGGEGPLAGGLMATRAPGVCLRERATRLGGAANATELTGALRPE
ncbi:Protein of unknown function [Gryllus bimaculatus]|nr:Protein of unknown function [Gryllus bimaculatus]